MNIEARYCSWLVVSRLPMKVPQVLKLLYIFFFGEEILWIFSKDLPFSKLNESVTVK